MKSADYLIIGQGLAGSCLAMELLARGKSVLVIDAVDPNSGSRVAAGMFNPVTSRVRQPSWKAVELFPCMNRFYRRLAAELNSDFYHPLPMYRPFPAAGDSKGWEDAGNPFVAAVRPPHHYGDFVHDPFGGIELVGSGFCDTTLLISSVRRRLTDVNMMVEQLVDPAWFVDGSWNERLGISAEVVICCEGYAITRNPLFDWLPIHPLKGEVLDVEADLPVDVLFNRGAWLVPSSAGLRNRYFRAGSTYDHHAVPGNTDDGMLAIRKRLERLLRVPFRQIGATWGFRPTTPDRRPVIGVHPERPQFWCFNGLGTKGVTLAPWLAVHLADVLESGIPILSEANISRFYPLYFKSFQKS